VRRYREPDLQLLLSLKRRSTRVSTAMAQPPLTPLPFLMLLRFYFCMSVSVAIAWMVVVQPRGGGDGEDGVHPCSTRNDIEDKNGYGSKVAASRCLLFV
jgi:hypothetical protein